MVFNKNRIVAILTVLGIQITSGIGLVNAICDNEIKVLCSEDSGHQLCDERRDKVVAELIQQFLDERKDYPVAEDQKRQRREGAAERYRNAMQVNKPLAKAYNNATMCVLEHTLSLNQNGTSGQQSNNNNSSFNQPSNSSASSNQSNASQSSSQSENSQTNTSQQTSTSKKGKKNPNDVPANCVKFNHDKTKIVNMCNFPINFSFCMMHQDDQSIQVANSCNDGFVSETVYPGRAISDESLNTRFFAISCKFPSKPINVRYISFSVPPEGNCPR